MPRKAKAAPVRVRLAVPHTHAGDDYQPGDEIDLRPDQATRLVEQGHAEELRDDD